MGTLWLGGAEALICPKFYTDNRRGYRISRRGGGEDIPQAHPPWTLSA